jgi:hypothetical protein
LASQSGSSTGAIIGTSTVIAGSLGATAVRANDKTTGEVRMSKVKANGIEPDMQISRIRLSDKTSRLHPRHELTVLDTLPD